MKNFLTQNINRAISETESDLRGESLGWGVHGPQTPENLYTATINLVQLAAGMNRINIPTPGDASAEDPSTPTDEKYVDVSTCTYDEYLAMCRRLYDDCDYNQQAAIRLIIGQIVRQSQQMKSEVYTGKRPPSHWLRPLDKDGIWGRTVLALCEAFGVRMELLVIL